MLLKHGTASDDPRTPFQDRFGDIVDVVGSLSAKPLHHRLSLVEPWGESVAADFQYKIEKFVVVGMEVAEEVPAETPLAQQLICRRGHHGLIRDQADPLGESQIAVNDFAADVRTS